MELTSAHWIYFAGVVIIIAVMIARKNVVVPAVAATFFTAWVYTGSFATGLTSVFNASLTAANELFSIFLIIALVTALLGALRALGADKRMIMPFEHLMRNGTAAFFSLLIVTYLVSLFFWPTPAVPLIGAILLPAAIRAGLPAMGAAIAMAIAGQGMALSSDYIIQVAPGISAKSAGVATETVADRALILSLITGAVAVTIAYMQVRRSIRRPDDQNLTEWEQDADVAPASASQVRSVEGSTGKGTEILSSGKATAPTLEHQEETQVIDPVKRSKAFAIIVPTAFVLMVAYMVVGKYTNLVRESSGDDAAALVGGVAAVLLLIAAITLDHWGALESAATHVVDGLVFAFKAMGVVLPIAGFFFIGNGEFATSIMSLAEKADPPAFLFDLVSSAQNHLPQNGIFMGLSILLIGIITGLDGSGFSGLPLTGSLSGALGPTVGVDPETLAAIGQMGSIWSGGGTFVAWSSVLAVAGFARVPVLELARKLFVPVIAGLVVSTIIGIIIF